VQRHANWAALIETHQPPANRVFAMTTRGSHNAFETAFQPGDWLVFGLETQGLKPEMREQFPEAQRLRLPMIPVQRSLNL
jgi:tRNA (cytidine/uridine-2'-O-)-methyltransferase